MSSARSATASWSSSWTGRRRTSSPSCRNARTASFASRTGRDTAWRCIPRRSRNTARDDLHQNRAVHRPRRAREIPRRGDRARRRYTAVAALAGVRLLGLSAALQPGRLSQPMALHAQAAMGIHPARRDGNRLARGHAAALPPRRALLRRGPAPRRRDVRRRAARPVERAARRRAPGHALRKGLVIEALPRRARGVAVAPPVERRAGAVSLVVARELTLGLLEAAPVVAHPAFPAGAIRGQVILEGVAALVIGLTQVVAAPVRFLGARIDLRGGTPPISRRRNEGWVGHHPALGKNCHWALSVLLLEWRALQ